MTRLRTYIATITMAAISLTGMASTFSQMTAREVGELLAEREESVPVRSQDTLRVNAMDMLSKVYGTVSTAIGRQECVRSAQRDLALTPHFEEGALWLDSADGYALAYNGMSPEVSAMARYSDNDELSEYCYFFLFPFMDSGREHANKAQALFTGCLLQEMYDLGLDLGVNVESDDIMEVVGDMAGGSLEVRLMEDPTGPEGGRYILMLIVEPGAGATDFTAER